MSHFDKDHPRPRHLRPRSQAISPPRPPPPSDPEPRAPTPSNDTLHPPSAPEDLCHARGSLRRRATPRPRRPPHSQYARTQRGPATPPSDKTTPGTRPRAAGPAARYVRQSKASRRLGRRTCDRAQRRRDPAAQTRSRRPTPTGRRYTVWDTLYLPRPLEPPRQQRFRIYWPVGPALLNVCLRCDCSCDCSCVCPHVCVFVFARTRQCLHVFVPRQPYVPN